MANRVVSRLLAASIEPYLDNVQRGTRVCFHCWLYDGRTVAASFDLSYGTERRIPLCVSHAAQAEGELL